MQNQVLCNLHNLEMAKWLKRNKITRRRLTEEQEIGMINLVKTKSRMNDGLLLETGKTRFYKLIRQMVDL